MTLGVNFRFEREKQKKRIKSNSPSTLLRANREVIRFLKYHVSLEKIRTFSWFAICRLVLPAVLVMIYLGWLIEAHPNLCGRLVYLSQPLPGNPDLLLYRLLAGLTEAINACFWLHKDLLRRGLW